MKRNGKPYSGELIEKYKKAYEAYLNLLKEHNDIKIWPMDIFGNITYRHGRYCTIRDNEYAPPTSVAGRKWVQIYRTPDNTE